MRRALTLVGLLAACVPPAVEEPPPPPPPIDAGFRAPCLRVFPEQIDFGEVEESALGVAQIQITNTSRFLRTLTALDLPAPFLISPPLQAFEVPLPAGSSRSFELQFLPRDALLHLGKLELRAGPDCEATVPMRGLGSGSVRAVPAALDFGFVPPGQAKTLELRLTNTRRVPVTASTIVLVNRTLMAFSAPLPSLELPATSSTSVLVTATPPTDDTFLGELELLTTGGGFVKAALQVVGGAPVAELSPTSFDLPHVGFDPGSAPPSFAERVVVLRNASTSGRSREAALRLVPPFFKVEAPDGGAVDELTVAAPARDSGLSLGGTASVGLRFVPTALGPRSYQLTIFTNDPARPEQVVTFSARVESLPQCTLQVAPLTELTLTPTPDGRAEGTITFENLGLTPCVVDDLRFTDSTPSTFSLRNAEAQVTIAGGASHTVTLVGPRSLFANTGELGFHVFNPNSVRQFITVHAPP